MPALNGAYRPADVIFLVFDFETHCRDYELHDALFFKSFSRAFCDSLNVISCHLGMHW